MAAASPIRTRRVREAAAHGERARVDGEAVVDEVVLGQPDLVEAELLRPLHLLELAVHDLGVAEPGRGLEEEEGPEAHGQLLIPARYSSVVITAARSSSPRPAAEVAVQS